MYSCKLFDIIFIGWRDFYVILDYWRNSSNFYIIISSNKFQLVIIKIDKAEEDIELYLQKKKELLERSRTIIEKEVKKEVILEGLDQSLDGFNHFDIHNHLKSLYNELFKIIDEHEKLLKSDSLMGILEELNDNEENIIGAIKF